MKTRTGWRIVLIVAGVLALAGLMLQWLIFEAAGSAGYAFWPLLVAFVALVIVLAPGLGRAGRRAGRVGRRSSKP